MTELHRAVPRAAGRPARRRGGSGVVGDGWWPVLFVAPLLIGVVVFYLWPIVQTFWFSFTTFGVFGGQTFSGVANYVALVQDPEFYLSLGNTLIYTAIVLLGVPLAVWLAALLNTPGLKFASFYRVLFFLPYIAMPTAVATARPLSTTVDAVVRAASVSCDTVFVRSRPSLFSRLPWMFAVKSVLRYSFGMLSPR